MHILIASPYLPWPLFEGGRVAQYRTFEALRDACTFTLIVPVHNSKEEADAAIFAGKFPNITVETVRCNYTTAPQLLCRRLRRKSVNILRNIFPVPKVPSHDQTPDHAAPDYRFNPLHPAFVATVEKKLNQGCDIFQAEFADMLTLGPFVAGRVPSLFVHLQLHFVYARRFMEANQVSNANARYLTERMIREESAYLKTFDSVIVLSEVDQRALKEFCPSLEINVSPCPAPEEPMPVALRFEKAVKHFVFVASSAHGPNTDGLSWFMKSVWPVIKGALPDATIEVIGRWTRAAQIRLPNHGDIRFAGFVEDLGKALPNKIMIVPVWIGSGIRTKILAAWGASCPVVTTSVGVEGLPGQSGEHFIVADEAPEFASACIGLAQDINKLNRIAANGLALVQKDYSLAAVRKTRLEIYEKLLAAPRLSKT